VSVQARGSAREVLDAACLAMGAAWCVLDGRVLIGERAHIEAIHRR
jgi:hypothetical protein